MRNPHNVKATENLERRRSEKENSKPELESSGNKSDQERRSGGNGVPRAPQTVETWKGAEKWLGDHSAEHSACPA